MARSYNWESTPSLPLAIEIVLAEKSNESLQTYIFQGHK